MIDIDLDHKTIYLYVFEQQRKIQKQGPRLY